jgi:hypothetical protein
MQQQHQGRAPSEAKPRGEDGPSARLQRSGCEAAAEQRRESGQQLLHDEESKRVSREEKCSSSIRDERRVRRSRAVGTG